MKSPRFKKLEMKRVGGGRFDPMFHCGKCGCAILSRHQMRNHHFRQTVNYRVAREPLTLPWG